VKKICDKFTDIKQRKEGEDKSRHESKGEKKKMEKRVKRAVIALCAGAGLLFTAAGYYGSHIPDSFYVEPGEKLELSMYPHIEQTPSYLAAAAVNQVYPQTRQVSLSLFGVIPIKDVEVHCSQAPILTAGGTPFGVKLLMDGVMVIRVEKVETEDGEKQPAADGGIQKGDIIRYINDQSVMSNKEIQKIIDGSGGQKLKVTVNRGGNEYETYVTPVYSKLRHGYCAGMWVRDSIAGIGTVTFVDRESGSFAGLGHPICDSDTGEIVPISSGEAVPVQISGVVKGKTGVPGELEGYFTTEEPMGILRENNKCGVYGELTSAARTIYSGKEYKMGYKQDVHEGKATILTTIDGSIAKEYSIEIKQVDYSSSDSTKNMVIEITDKELLEKTGGIVQGMSGSPIIQDGRLIGAVTHVFVADSSQGYGIFAENMYDYMGAEK
jgi:stage IV sporulation protein B